MMQRARSGASGAGPAPGRHGPRNAAVSLQITRGPVEWVKSNPCYWDRGIFDGQTKRGSRGSLRNRLRGSPVQIAELRPDLDPARGLVQCRPRRMPGGRPDGAGKRPGESSKRPDGSGRKPGGSGKDRVGSGKRPGGSPVGNLAGPVGNRAELVGGTGGSPGADSTGNRSRPGGETGHGPDGRGVRVAQVFAASGRGLDGKPVATRRETGRGLDGRGVRGPVFCRVALLLPSGSGNRLQKGYSALYPRPYLNFSQHTAEPGNRH
jgi:hypothetical protein